MEPAAGSGRGDWGGGGASPTSPLLILLSLSQRAHPSQAGDPGTEEGKID